MDGRSISTAPAGTISERRHREAKLSVALPAGAVLLWVGFALALALAMLAGLALLPSWLRSLWPRREVPRGPTTIEGSYTKHVE